MTEDKVKRAFEVANELAQKSASVPGCDYNMVFGRVFDALVAPEWPSNTTATGAELMRDAAQSDAGWITRGAYDNIRIEASRSADIYRLTDTETAQSIVTSGKVLAEWLVPRLRSIFYPEANGVGIKS